MRKQISVTNKQVLKYFSKQENVSKYIEKCVLQYEDFKENDYITREEVLELLSNQGSSSYQVTKADIQDVLDL